MSPHLTSLVVFLALGCNCSKPTSKQAPDAREEEVVAEQCSPVRGIRGPCDNPMGTTRGCGSGGNGPSVRVEYDGPNPLTSCDWTGQIYNECVPERPLRCKRSVGIRYNVDTSGRVTRVDTSEDSPYDDEVARCMGEHVKKMHFGGSDKEESASLRFLLNYVWIEAISQKLCPQAVLYMKNTAKSCTGECGSKSNPTTLRDTTGLEFGWECEDTKCKLEPPDASEYELCKKGEPVWGAFAWSFFSICATCTNTGKWPFPLSDCRAVVCDEGDRCPVIHWDDRDFVYNCTNGYCQLDGVTPYPERVYRLDATLMCYADVPRTETTSLDSPRVQEINEIVMEACEGHCKMYREWGIDERKAEVCEGACKVPEECLKGHP